MWDLGKEAMRWVIKMLGFYIKQRLIKKGIITTGSLPIDVGIFYESTKEPVDSDCSIKIESRYNRTIGKCRVLLNKEELQWANKKGRKEISILPHGSENVRIPKDASTENARVQIWDGKTILMNIKFEDIPLS